jgi:hypothetical protein
LMGQRARRNALYMHGVISLTPARQFAQHCRQLEQLGRSKVCASGRNHYEGIGSDNVRPGRWQRAHTSLAGLSEEDPVLAPGVGEADHLVVVAAQRMKRVRYTKSFRIAATAGS